MDSSDDALLDLLRALAARDYRFVTPTNDAIGRMHRRCQPSPPTLRDLFGWSLALDLAAIPQDILAPMQAAGILRPDGDRWRSTLRVSTIGERLFLHSAFPTDADDAVFLGPDTWRFVRFLGQALSGWQAPDGVLVDIGAGPGAGGLTVARAYPALPLVLTDVNPKALGLARVNAAFAGIACDLRRGEGLEPVSEPVALAIANPPFIAGKDGHQYEDGGGLHGGAISLDWARQAMERLAPGGRLAMYTGAAIVGGRDELKAALAEAADQADCRIAYEELDPDIFTDELENDAYADVERIAAVGAVIDRPA